MNGSRLFLLLAAATVMAAGDARSQSAWPADELRLRPGDVVRVLVKDEPHLSGEFPVHENGAAMLPMIGMIAMADRPLGEIRTELQAAYAAELVDPEFWITPLVRIAVLGEVRMPRLIPVDPTMTLADVLAAAGGLMPTANPRRISLVRGREVVRAQLDPESAVLGAHFRSGDQIIVARQGWFREHMAIFVGAAASVAAAAATSLILR